MLEAADSCGCVARNVQWKSGLREIELTDSAIEADYIAEFLKPMVHLRSFRYHHEGFGCSNGYFWDGGSFLAALQVSTIADTLEELSLSGRGDAGILSAMRSFEGFKKLRWLELDVKLLRGPPEHGQGDLASMELRRAEDVCAAFDLGDKLKPTEWWAKYNFSNVRLVDMLPSSIQTVELGVGKDGDYYPIFTDLDVKRHMVPVLTSIRVHGYVLSERRNRQTGTNGRVEAYAFELPDQSHHNLRGVGIDVSYVEVPPYVFEGEHTQRCRHLRGLLMVDGMRFSWSYAKW